jgi:flagellin-like protein
MVKKGQANIVAVVLIVLIVLVAVGIVWNFVAPLVKEKSQEIQFGKFTINLELRDVVLFENGVLMINVHRGSGNENLDGLKFVFYDEEGNSVTREGRTISELETRTYSFSAIPEIGKISKVGVAPIINGKLGMLTESKPDSILKIPSGVVSWWRFDDLIDFIGGNTCTPGEGEGGINNGVLNGKVSCSANDLNFVNEMAISFWVKGNANQIIITKGDNNKISIENKKLRFDFGAKNGISFEELNEGWNHIVISISPAFLKIYVNKAVKIFEPNYFEPNNENLIINGEVDDVMFFDIPITNIEGIYNIQKKD